MTDEQIEAVARRAVEILRAERDLRTAVWGLLAQADSAAIEQRAVAAHAEHVRAMLD